MYVLKGAASDETYGCATDAARTAPFYLFIYLFIYILLFILILLSKK